MALPSTGAKISRFTRGRTKYREIQEPGNVPGASSMSARPAVSLGALVEFGPVALSPTPANGRPSRPKTCTRSFSPRAGKERHEIAKNRIAPKRIERPLGILVHENAPYATSL